MDIKKLHFVCCGCGKARPCYVEINHEQRGFDDPIEDLKCILDETNQTGYKWEYYTPKLESHQQADSREKELKKCCTCILLNPN